MKLPRRAFLYLAAGTAAVLTVSQIAWSQIAWAQAYPARPVRIMVGFPPGGPADILARLLGQRLSERLGQPFIIENRPGASGNIATEAVTRAPADGHTLLLVVPGNAVSDLLSDKLNFSFMRDTTPVAGISNGPLVMEVNPAIPVHTVPEFIAYTQDRPGKVNFASPGTGSTIQLCGELNHRPQRLPYHDRDNEHQARRQNRERKNDMKRAVTRNVVTDRGGLADGKPAAIRPCPQQDPPWLPIARDDMQAVGKGPERAGI